MSETDPGHSDQHAGDVGARRATVGTPTEGESINVPPTRPGAADNARQAQAARQGHETFIPENPIPDERSEAQESLRAEEETMRGTRGHHDGGASEARADEGDVRKDIEETRARLGDTVSQLAAKTDVKARASTAVQTAKGKAAGAADTVKGKTSEVAGKIGDHTPERVKEAGKRPVLLIVAAGAAAALVVRRMMRRRKGR